MKVDADRARSHDALGPGEPFEAAYEELRRLAAAIRRRERANPTLQTTALVHEAYLKLFAARPPLFEDRAHFFGIAARAMRQVLVDSARRAAAARRPPRAARVELSEEIAGAGGALDPLELLAIDSALAELEALDPRQARVVELRWFAGLTAAETAAALGVAEVTVHREWRSARAWLEVRLGGEGRAR